jgi:hypothetical protein
MSANNRKIMDEQALRKFFHFTENDLYANRHGQFSDAQKRRLSAEARAEQKSARESATILFVIAAVGLMLGLVLASIAPTLMGRILFILLLGVLWTGAWAGRGVKIIRDAHALQEPRLCTGNGRAHLIREGEDVVLQLGEMEFHLDGNPAGVIFEGEEYTVYYLEATEEILSVE